MVFDDLNEKNFLLYAMKEYDNPQCVQVEEFYDELSSQVESANANRVAALRQFEVSESNALQQFNRQIVDSRDKFDANMKFAIDQSNVVWRRERKSLVHGLLFVKSSRKFQN